MTHALSVTTRCWPLAGLWVLVLALHLVAALGLLRLDFGHGLDRLFQSNASRYSDYVEFIAERGSTNGLLVLIEGEDLTRPEAQAALIDFVLDLQFLDGAGAVLSPFSVPIPDPGQGFFTLDQVTDWEHFDWQGLHERQPAMRRVLSESFDSALVTAVGMGSRADIAAVSELTEAYLTPAGLEVTYTGLPVLANRSVDNLFSDFFFLTGLGICISVAMAFLALRGWWVAITAILSSVSAVLWGVGTLGWLGVEINVVSIALPILLLALSFSDAIHLGMEQRRLFRVKAPRPVLTASRRIGPAVLLTAITTAIAFLSLRLSGSDIIIEMGTGGAVAVMIAGIGVLANSTLLGWTVLTLVGSGRLAEQSAASTRRLFDWQWLPQFAIRSDRPVRQVGLILTGLACILYLFAEPRFSMRENLRDEEPAIQAIARIEAAMGPASTLQIVVPGAGQDPLAAAEEVTRIVTDLAPELRPVSLATLNELSQEAGLPLAELLDQLPDPLRARMAGGPGADIVVTVPFSDQGSIATRALVSEIEAEIAALPPSSPAAEAWVTGVEVMAAFVSHDMIRALSLSLLCAILTVGAVIAGWFRDLRLGLLALVPSLLPVAMVGAGLYVSGFGLSFSGGIALTLAFGIAVDDTIHVMNRFRLSQDHGEDRLTDTMRDVTAPVVVTSLVLSAGLAGTFAAHLPTIAEFGSLSILVIMLALLADLLFLPALLKRYSP